MVSGRGKSGKGKQAEESADAPREEQHAPTPSTDEPLLFYMPDAKYGEFCQWRPSQFTVTKEEIAKTVGREAEYRQVGADEENPSAITFNCAEQFMMYCKAARYGDHERQVRIMATGSPKEQKRLGKMTVGFTDESWDKVKSEVVVAGNLAKFRQNVHLRRKLLATGDRMLCEAASKDRVWGIGYNAKTAMTQRKHWGENRLGKCLMIVRDQLRAEDSKQCESPAW